MLGDFFGHPVTIDALWCEDQGEVNLPSEEQHTYVIDKNLGLTCPHLHEVAELFFEAPMIQCHLLVVEWFIFKIVLDSHHIPPVESTLRMATLIVKRIIIGI